MRKEVNHRHCRVSLRWKKYTKKKTLKTLVEKWVIMTCESKSPFVLRCHILLVFSIASYCRWKFLKEKKNGKRKFLVNFSRFFKMHFWWFNIYLGEGGTELNFWKVKRSSCIVHVETSSFYNYIKLNDTVLLLLFQWNVQFYCKISQDTRNCNKKSQNPEL